MSGIENLLRDAYQAAARTVSPELIRPAVQLPQHKPGRAFNAFVPLVAAAAVVAAIAGAVTVPRLLHSTQASSQPAAAGQPPFVVSLPYYGTAVAKLVVQAAGTNHVAAFVSPPRGTQWEAVAATGSSTTFVAAATSDYCSTRLYTLTLSADGKRTRLSPMGGKISGHLVTATSLAASADGRTIGYATASCGDPVNTTVPKIIGAITPAGADRYWTLPSTTSPTSLSLSADGSLLGYVAFKTGGAWVLPTGSPPGDAFGHSHEVVAGGGRTETVAASLSADSKTMYVVTATSSSRGPYTITLAAYHPASGILVRKLHTWGNVSPLYPTGVTIGGNQLLIWGIYQPATFQVDLASGSVKSFWVFTPDGEFPEAVAW